MECCRLIIFFVVGECLLCVTYVSSLKNLALGRDTWEQYPWTTPYKDWGSKNAVDGLYTNRGAGGTQCTISNNFKKTAEWRVDLGDIVSISHIDIYYRTDNLQMPSSYTSRLAGFFLYISNTTSKDGSHLCFHEIQTMNRTPSENQRIQCPIQGRFVIYYNERKQGVIYPSYYSKNAYNELCEVEVFGCSKRGFYGDNCTLPCPSNCREIQCNITNGHCTSCVSGYYGLSCNQVCAYKTYGQDCSLRCGNCSNGETCHHVNGSCLYGCDAGVSGDQCKIRCLPGFFGKDCINNCSGNCMNSTSCDRFIGHCDGGCKPGWTGDTCDQKCHAGLYGKDCMYQCSVNCYVTSRCDRFTGTCAGGCKPGWTDAACIFTCNHTFYGPNCTQKCDTACKNQACDYETGECIAIKQADEQANIPIIGGSIAGVIVLLVLIYVIFIYKRVCRTRNVPRKDRCNPDDIGNTTDRTSFSNVTPNMSNIYQNITTDDHDHKGLASLKKHPVRRHEQLDKENNRREVMNDDFDIDEKIHEENPYGDFYMIEDIHAQDIAAINLKDVIRDMCKSEDDGFKKEYATLLYGERYSCESGKLPENLTRNRFKTTFPYDHSRVILANRRPDYINANYIDGIRAANNYIATQGVNRLRCHIRAKGCFYREKTSFKRIFMMISEEKKI